ncbi:unnamed protein product [Lampetra planeri]
MGRPPSGGGLARGRGQDGAGSVPGPRLTPPRATRSSSRRRLRVGQPGHVGTRAEASRSAARTTRRGDIPADMRSPLLLLLLLLLLIATLLSTSHGETWAPTRSISPAHTGAAGSGSLGWAAAPRFARDDHASSR